MEGVWRRRSIVIHGRRPRLSAAAVLTGVLMFAGVAAAQRLGDPECLRILGTDAAGTPLREAAIRNLAAAALRESGAEGVRRTTEAAIAALAAGSGGDAGTLCSALAVERVRADALLTGYYRPLVSARLSREGAFRYPLYALPEPGLRELPRADIDRGALEGKAPVIAWLDDPVETFFVHIQGSALLALPGGPIAVGYAGSNGRPYTSIGTWLVKNGRMRQEDVSMGSLKVYLRDHPSEREAILQANARYIYFRRLDAPPVGSLGVPLTDGRSVAADPGHYPPGTLIFINPIGEDRTGVYGRLAFVQDRGSAITGPARLDLFVGTGDEAGRIAGALRQQVEVFVLRAK